MPNVNPAEHAKLSRRGLCGILVIIGLIITAIGGVVWANQSWVDSGPIIAKGSFYDGAVHQWMDVRTVSHGIIRLDEIIDAFTHPECEMCFLHVNETIGITAYPHVNQYDWSPVN